MDWLWVVQAGEESSLKMVSESWIKLSIFLHIIIMLHVHFLYIEYIRDIYNEHFILIV